MDPLNISAKFDTCSFSHSRDNRGYFKNLGSPCIRPRSIVSKIFKGLLFTWTLWIYLPNLKFVALPVPEIIGGSQKIWAVPGYAHAPFSPKLFMGLCSDGPYECIGSSRSWDNSNCSFGVGLRTPVLGERGGREWYRMKERLWLPIGSLIVTFPLSLRVSEILPLLCSRRPGRHFFPTHLYIVSPKFLHVPLGIGGWPLGYEERRFPTYVILIHQRHRQTDGRHAISIPRYALAHRAVNMSNRSVTRVSRCSCYCPNSPVLTNTVASISSHIWYHHSTVMGRRSLWKLLNFI